MKTQYAIQLAGSGLALARILGITSSAVSQWGDQVPEARVWQLRVLHPDWFADDALEQKTCAPVQSAG